MEHKPVQRVLVIALFMWLCVASAGAQSGRRVQKSPPLPPVPAPAAEPVAPASTQKPKPALTVVVGLERSDYIGGAAYVNENAALLALVDRLDDHPGVEVSYMARSMARSDAIRRAKLEKEAFVIFVDLNFDRMSNELRLTYWVFSPQTAKIKTSGQTYPQMYRNRGVILNPRTGGYGDRQLEEAAREIAERVLKAFQLHLPTGRMAL